MAYCTYLRVIIIISIIARTGICSKGSKLYTWVARSASGRSCIWACPTWIMAKCTNRIWTCQRIISHHARTRVVCTQNISKIRNSTSKTVNCCISWTCITCIMTTSTYGDWWNIIISRIAKTTVDINGSMTCCCAINALWGAWSCTRSTAIMTFWTG